MAARYTTDTLTVYEEDDETVLFEVSTDRAHQAPFLKPFENFPEQEIDFAKGAASIGQMTVGIVDVPTDPTDQATGYMSGLLADPTGGSQLLGHRVVAKQDVGSGAATVLDGVIRSVRLLDNFSAYELVLRDIRERERKTRAFVRTSSPTVFPRGVLDGYGVTLPILATTTVYPIPPTEPLTATYHSVDSNQGRLVIDDGFGERLHADGAMLAALGHTRPLEATPNVRVFDQWKLLWREAGSADPYAEITEVRHSGSTYAPVPYVLRGGKILTVYLNNFVSGDTLPSDQDSVEFVIRYDGPVTEDWPLHLQGLTVGQFLRNAYRGDYSDEPPRIRYNEAALLALTTPVRAIIKEPAPDLREYNEKNAYPIANAAPAINDAGEIAPVTYLLPDEDETLVTLSDSNCRPAGGGWSHGSEDAINLVRVKYQRDYVLPVESTADTAPIPTSERVASREVTVEHHDTDSIALLGEQELTIESELLRSIAGPRGMPLVGDATDEVADQVARRTAHMAVDRLSRGGQYFALEGMRTDSDVEAVRVGDYVVVGVTWQPDYNTAERGANRLAQVLGRRNLDATWCSLTLIDAGSAFAPLGQPSFGVISVDSDGVVSIPITALPTTPPNTRPKAQARVDYAVNATEPPASSLLWQFLNRVRYAPKTLLTPRIAPGKTVWVRARGEARGRRPSAYTTPTSVSVATATIVEDVGIVLDGSAIPTVSWTPNPYCQGVRVYYKVHDAAELPGTISTSVEVSAADGSVQLTSLRVPAGKAISIEVQPWTGWTGSAVSGSSGTSVEDRALGTLEPQAPWVQAEFDRDAEDELATLTLTIVDPQGTITSVEYSKREGSQSGDTFAAYSATWDTEPSSPPYDGTYEVEIAVPGGEESAIKWRVSFVDIFGNARTIGSTHYTSQVDEHEAKIFIPYSQFRPEIASQVDNYDISNGYLTNGVTGADVAHRSSTVLLPVGVEVTEVEMVGYVESLNQDGITLTLYRGNSSGETAVTFFSLTTNGWSTAVDEH